MLHTTLAEVRAHPTRLLGVPLAVALSVGFVVASLVFVVVVGASVVAAGEKLGFDFLAYHQAAVRLLNGQPLYDMSFQTTGGFGL